MLIDYECVLMRRSLRVDVVLMEYNGALMRVGCVCGWLVGWSVLVCAFVCAFVSAFVCSFRGLFARVSCPGLRFCVG